MTAIFKEHEECQRPRTILIEGDPGMGKTTYCQKLAYDWATKQDEWDPSFPKIEVLLFLRCHEMKSNIWEAIDDQILPGEIENKDKECFFKFICEKQSRVLLVLDGLDEADPSNLKMFSNLVESRDLSGCYIVLTSRHEAGRKVRRFCDTLWEIVGFTKEDAEDFIRKYFKNIKKEHLAGKLIAKIWSSNKDLQELTKNPLNATLLCVLYENLEDDLPTSRTNLYIEIVLCVLRRYEQKQGLSSKIEDLFTNIYKASLLNLGRMALQSLQKGELYLEEHECDSSISTMSRFGFLSLQAAVSKLKTTERYVFLHKSFQEFFSGFYLANQILNEDIDCDSVVTDRRYMNELYQVFFFMTGILARTKRENADTLVKRMAVNINSRSCENDKDIAKHFVLVLRCLSENLCLVRTLGANLSLSNLNLVGVVIGESAVACLSEALTTNSSITTLNVSDNWIGDSGVRLFSQPLSKANSVLTNLHLCRNGIGDSGAASISQALLVNSSLAYLDLSWNKIGDSGADSLFEALLKNSSLTSLDVSHNCISDLSADSLFKLLKKHYFLTDLDLSGNRLAANGADALSQGLAANSSLRNLDLRWNRIKDSGAEFLSQALVKNSSLASLHLSGNRIGNSGANYLSTALKDNSSLTYLDLSSNLIDESGAASLSRDLAVNSSLTELNLGDNEIGDDGASSFAQVLEVISSLTKLNLSENEVGDKGAISLAQALRTNASLTHLNLSENRIGPSGTAYISEALTANSTLTYLDLRLNKVGYSGHADINNARGVNKKVKVRVT
ncbi:NACHT [Porites harrisoni]